MSHTKSYKRLHSKKKSHKKYRERAKNQLTLKLWDGRQLHEWTQTYGNLSNVKDFVTIFLDKIYGKRKIFSRENIWLLWTFLMKAVATTTKNPS